MSSPSEPLIATASPRRSPWTVLHFVGFTVFLVAWTIALLVPIPKKTATEVLGGDDPIFWFGKCLHISVYALLTFAGISLPLSRGQQKWLLAGFVLHGATTEFFQQFVERGASVRDVFLDAIGVALGWVAWRWLCSRHDEPL